MMQDSLEVVKKTKEADTCIERLPRCYSRRELVQRSALALLRDRVHNPAVDGALLSVHLLCAINAWNMFQRPVWCCKSRVRVARSLGTHSVLSAERALFFF